jgi:hypothetical protein
VNLPRWINSTAGHRGASLFQQSGQAEDRLIAYGEGRGAPVVVEGKGGPRVSQLVRNCLMLCSLGRGGWRPCGGLARGLGMPRWMQRQLERWHRTWVAEAAAVPRRRRSSQPAGEGEQVGCCF